MPHISSTYLCQKLSPSENGFVKQVNLQIIKIMDTNDPIHKV